MALRVASKAHFHTCDQVRGYVEDALATMADLELDTGEHRELLVKLVELLAASQAEMEQISPTGVLMNGRRGL